MKTMPGLLRNLPPDPLSFDKLRMSSELALNAVKGQAVQGKRSADTPLAPRERGAAHPGA